MLCYVILCHAGLGPTILFCSGVMLGLDSWILDVTALFVATMGSVPLDAHQILSSITRYDGERREAYLSDNMFSTQIELIRRIICTFHWPA